MNHEEFKRGWSSGLPETKCGSGSQLKNTAIQREWLPAMVAKHNIESIADIGCGDRNWAKHTDFGCEYRGYDLVPRVAGVEKFDLLKDPLPHAHSFMCLWVINHLTRTQAQHATHRLLHGRADYLFITYRAGLYNFIDRTVLDSVDIGNGAEIRLLQL